MTKFKTKNVILATIACLLVLILAIFVLAACGETEKPNPDAVVKDDFTWEETQEIWNKMLENITNADRISTDILVPVEANSEEYKKLGRKVITDNTYYSINDSNNTKVEQWLVFEEGTVTEYIINTTQGHSTNTKTNKGEDFNKVELWLGTQIKFSMEILKSVQKFGDGSYIITLADQMHMSETTYNMSYEYKLNANCQLIQLVEKADGVIVGKDDYKYGLDADTIPTRPSNVEWGN